MDLDPIKILFTIVMIGVFMAALVGFAISSTSFSTRVRTNDVDRQSIEIAENIMSSEITSSRHIFDPKKMDSLIGQELSVRSCTFSYRVEIEDKLNDKKWVFGKEPSNQAPDPYDSTRRSFDVGILQSNVNKDSDFYQSITPGKLTLTLYDYFLGRVSCAIEEAAKLKHVENVTLDKCSAGTCAAIRKVGNNVCLFYNIPSSGEPANLDCKSIPPSINFETLYETYESLREQGIDPKKKMNIVMYPLRSPATCASVKDNPEIYVTNKDDAVAVILLCVENVK